jgi:hypothetical protein
MQEQYHPNPEAVMKRTAIVLAAVLATTALTVKAGTPADRLTRAEKNYAAAFETGNDGAIMSALAAVAVMKSTYPERPFDRIRHRVEEVAASGATPAIRHRAYLTLLVFTSPEMLAGVDLGRADAETVFTTIAEKVHEGLITHAK